MNSIDRSQLENWASIHNAKGDFPLLISRLIRATTSSSTKIKIPSGSAVYLGGPDGVVENADEDNQYVPKGVSIWELGTSNNPKTKADDDYGKRTKNPVGYTPSDCVFVFVTPRHWEQKDKWLEEKKKEGIWSDVVVIDSIALTSWINYAPAIGIWFAGLCGRDIDTGITQPEQFWREYSRFTNIELVPEVIASGRELVANDILEFFKNEPNIKAIKSSNKNESIAFIIAAAMLAPKDESEYFFSKAVIVKNPTTYRSISQSAESFKSKLILIPKFDEHGAKFDAVTRGHHVLVPLGADDDNGWNNERITLPIIDAEGQVAALVKSGIDEEKAHHCSREGSRDITFVKKHLGFPAFDMAWLDDQNLAELLPAMLLGKWDEKYQGDRNIVAEISNMNYEDYQNIIERWKNIADSPIIKVGTIWRLKSTIDVWIQLSSHIKTSDLEFIKKIFNTVFSNDANVQNKIGNFRVKTHNDFSGTLVKGILQNITLIGFYEKNLKIAFAGPSISGKVWVDTLIKDFFTTSTQATWRQISHYLRQIAEASPTTFLNIIETDITRELGNVRGLFEEKQDSFFPTSNHTSLLWALEGLAWHREYLNRASLILAKLVEIDPGGYLSNRPFNSLAEIYKSWRCQTSASQKERMAVLEKMADKYPKVAFDLLIRLIEDPNGQFARNTHKFRWRSLELDASSDTMNLEEILKTQYDALDLTVKVYDGSIKQFILLSRQLWTQDSNKRERIVALLSSKLDLLDNQDRITAWKELTEKIGIHKKFRDVYWSLRDDELTNIQELHSKLKPAEYIESVRWIFDEYSPNSPYSSTKKDITNSTDENNEIETTTESETRFERKQILLELVMQYPIIRILKEFSSSVTAFEIGSILAEINLADSSELEILHTVKDDANNIARGYISEKTKNNNTEWVFDIFDKMVKSGIPANELGVLFSQLKPSSLLWDKILGLGDAVYSNYWSRISVPFGDLDTETTERGIRTLMDNKRNKSALTECYYNIENNRVSTALVYDVLFAYIKRQDLTIRTFDEHIAVSLIKFVQDNTTEELEEKTMQLEWNYLPFLNDGFLDSKAKYLAKKMAENPDFFIDVLCTAYKSEIEDDEDIQDLNLTRNAYLLISSWQVIPGTNSDGTIDGRKLNTWVNTVRVKSVERNRLRVADSMIGAVLAQFPEKLDFMGVYPPIEICKILENYHSESMTAYYSNAIANKRAFTRRGIFEGGDIERADARYYANIASQLEITYPKVAQIFKDLSDCKTRDADYMDAQAENSKLEY